MKLKTLQLIIVVFLTILLSSCKAKQAQSIDVNPQEKIDSLIQSYIDNVKFNGNILVFQEEEKLFEKAYGFATGTQDVSMSSAHRFAIGSIYKEFPAVAIMQLQEQGLLQIDNSLSEYLDGFPDWANTITIKDLLQYTSGLPKIDWNVLFNQGEVTDTTIFKYINSIEQLEFKPGTGYIYSNYNPILLIKIVERITTLSFEDYLNRNIFKPNGIHSIVFKDAYPYVDRYLMANPFDTNFKEDAYKIRAKSLLLTASTEGLYKWLTLLYSEKLISKQSLKTLSEKYKTGSEYQSPLGTLLWENNNLLKHVHHGSSGNYESLVVYDAKRRLTIIILTNQKHGNVHEISKGIQSIITSK